MPGRKMMQLPWFCLLCGLSQALSMEVTTGECLSGSPQPVAASARACAFACAESNVAAACGAWSFDPSSGACNLTDTTEAAEAGGSCRRFEWTRQHKLVGHWPLNRRRRLASVHAESPALAANGEVDFSENAARINASVELDVPLDTFSGVASFTIAMWAKVTNPALGPMPLLEGITLPSTFHTNFWLFPSITSLWFVITAGPVYCKTTSGKFPSHVWNFVSATYDSVTGVASLALNATSVPCDSQNITNVVTPTWGSQVQVGRATRTVAHNTIFDGLKSCVSVASKALQLDELRQLAELCRPF